MDTITARWVRHPPDRVGVYMRITDDKYIVLHRVWMVDGAMRINWNGKELDVGHLGLTGYWWCRIPEPPKPVWNVR